MFDQLAADEAGEMPPPTIEEFTGGIPPLVWPD
jgi:hypothetical protein